MKIRIDAGANYKAIFLESGKTLRFKLNPKENFGIPITPEIEDVAINDVCLANCPYCYTSATNKGKNFDRILEKADYVWGNLSPAQRPFQIAIGGAGESTMHPLWCEFVRHVKDMEILPNYTTNGMHLSPEILSATEKYCGGVAVSWHPHISKVFHQAVEKLKTIKTRINFHIIVGAEESYQDLISLYERYEGIVDYFVLLPYQAAGRAKQIECEKVWTQCINWVQQQKTQKFAFGALFYRFLKKNSYNLNMSFYEPELFSGYRILNNNYDILYKSSYNLEPKNVFRN